MTLRYRYNDSPIAEGERVMFLQNGKLFVRTGLIDATDDVVQYRLREVYDDTAPQNLPPMGGEINANYEVK